MGYEGRRKGASSDVYHVMCRGTAKQLIFEDNADRRQYMALLDTAFSEGDEGRLLAWCLMDNHVHLLVRARLPVLSQSMQRLNSAYARYFNKRYDRVGHLFQGRYKSVPVESDSQLIATVRYIHQNPWKAGYASSCSYPWSSYEAYLHAGELSDSLGEIVDLFGGLESFVRLHASLDDEHAQNAYVCRGRRSVSDMMAVDVARQVLGETAPGSVAGLPRGDRDTAVARLAAAGLSCRQIERLTGVSKSVVARLLA